MDSNTELIDLRSDTVTRPDAPMLEAMCSAPLGDDEINLARKKLNWPHQKFEIPQVILSAWRVFGSRSSVKYDSWLERFNSITSDERTEFKRVIDGLLPSKWSSGLDNYKQECILAHPKLATRKASGQVLNLLTQDIHYRNAA